MNKKLKTFLKEGGNAIAGTKRINQENVRSTVDSFVANLKNKINIHDSDLALFGTTGKKAPGDSSGDMDIGINIDAFMKATNTYELDRVYDKMVGVLRSFVSGEVKINRGFGIVSCGYPISNIDGKQQNQKVQIDVFLVDNLDYAKWIFYGPSYHESTIKPLYRNILLASLAKYVLQYKAEPVSLTTREKLIFNFSKGLFRVVQSKQGKKDLLKNFKTIDSFLLTNDPDEISSILFGPKYKATDLLTFESVYKALMSPDFIFKQYRGEILSHAKQTLIKLGYPVPF
jgi:hypothetical protein